MNQKIGVVGDQYSTLLFKLFGFQVEVAVSAKQIRQTIERMAKENYGIIFLTEDAAILVEETIEKYKNQLTPAIILIPGQHGTKGIGQKSIQENVERAIGQNIL